MTQFTDSAGHVTRSAWEMSFIYGPLMTFGAVAAILLVVMNRSDQVAMSLILAIEPNKNQAHQLNALVRQYLKAELVDRADRGRGARGARRSYPGPGADAGAVRAAR